MKKAYPPSSLLDVYSWVGKSTLSLWPLLIVKLLFLILQYVALFFCLVLLLGPFFSRNSSKLMEGLSNPKNYDWSPVLSDWSSTLTDPGWIVIGMAVLFLYVTWWCLLSAVEDGGVYGTFWDFFIEGRLFSWKVFFEKGFHFVFPMIWLQLYLSLWFLAVFMVWVIVALVAVGIMALTGFNMAFGIALGLMLGIPAVIFWIVFALCFGVFTFLSKAYLTQGKQAGEAVRLAFAKFKANGWKVGIGLLVAFITYIAVSVGFRMVLGLFSLIPFIGLLFSLLDMLVGCVLALFIMIYLSGLSVAYLQDEAAI